MGEVFVRLVTAIPLLFWVGSAAVVHFVHACVAAPVVAADVATGDPAFEAASAPADAFVDTGSKFTCEAEHHGQHAATPPQAESQATPSAGRSSFSSPRASSVILTGGASSAALRIVAICSRVGYCGDPSARHAG